MAQKKYTCNWQVKHGDKGKAKTYQRGDPMTMDEVKAKSLLQRGAIAPAAAEAETDISAE